MKADKYRFTVPDAMRLGLISGAGAVLVSLVGMVKVFNERGIIAGVVSLGQIMILLILLIAGYIAARRATGGSRRAGLLQGGLAGLAAGACLAALVLLGSVINLRAMFVSASPELYKILTFDQGVVAGAGILLVVSAAVGVAGALLRQLPSRPRRTVIVASVWVLTLGLLQELLRLTLGGDVIRALRWMFGTGGQKGLSIVGAVLVFAVVAVVHYQWTARNVNPRAWTRSLPPDRQRAVRWGSLALAALILFSLPNILGVYLSEVANAIGLFVLLGLGLNIVVGFAGLLDLGYVAFFAIGAYVMGVATTTAVGAGSGLIVYSPGFNFWQALPLAVLASVLAGVILGIPVLKMRGDYLAIVTLGFGEIIRILAISDFLKPYIGGSQGIVGVGVGQIGSFAFDAPQSLYYLVLAGCLLAAFVSTRLKDSRIGRAWMAMREDEDVAQAIGIDLVKTKLLAFATGAAFSGLSGAIFASKLGSIYPHSFSLLISINALSLIIVGGMGSIPGVIIGALALAGLPELLREFAEFRLLVYGAALMAMMLLRPEGLWPEETLRRELHDAAEGGESEPAPEAARATN